MRVLFVCNGGTARSQEAAAFFNASGSANSAVAAGTDAILGKPIDPAVVETMQEVGLDLSKAQRRLVTKEMAEMVDKIISFKPRTELPNYLAGSTKLETWDVADPRKQSSQFHRQVRDDIRNRVDRLLKDIEGSNPK